jgi:hypothetical protein
MSVKRPTGGPSPIKLVIVAATATVIGLSVVGVLGVAAAEAPTTTSSSTTTVPTTTTTAPPSPTVSVQGVATEAIEASAGAATATAVYRQGMADAIVDGQSKAQFLASKTGASLGAVQSITENGGFITCAGEIEYTGEQPDFGSPGVSGSGVSARGVLAPQTSAVVHRPTTVKRRRHGAKGPSAKAKRAVASGCTLSAQVSLVYALEG